jgi:peptidoglycan/LPS O-acetylase OafA/YrhL
MTKPTQLPSLTALRIVAASLVFFSHGLILPIFADPGAANIYGMIAHNMGAIGVLFFFILSGFVLTWSASHQSAEADTPGKFWRRRFFKIYPNHFAVYVIFLILVLASGHPFFFNSALSSLFLVHAWWPDPTLMLFAVNGPTWSLSVEMFFYLCFPLLLPLISRIPRRGLWPTAAIVAAIALLMPVIASALLPDQPMSPFSTNVSWPRLWFLYYLPVTRLFEFVLGMIMARILISGAWVRIRPFAALLLVLATYIATTPILVFDGHQALFLVPLALLITSCAASDVDGRAGLLTRPTFVWLGNISYAFFVVHITVLFSLYALFSGFWGFGGPAHPFSTPGGIAFLAGAYLLTVFFAWLLYTLVEKPAMRRFARARVAAPAQPEVAPAAV